MDRDCRVAEHRLGARRGNRHVCRLARLWIDHRIAEVPEVALHDFVKHLVIADRRLQERIPIHQPLAAIDQSFAEQIEERLSHRLGTHRPA